MGHRGCSNLLRCARHGSLSSLLPNSRANFCCSGLNMASRLSSSSSASSVSSGDSSFLNARGYIEHKVTKLDTLAGVAIKYGVEVADVKRMNGLQTDIQMFGLQTLRIPLPGRHPPSAVLSSDQSSPRSEEVHPSSRLRNHTQLKYGSLANLKAQKPSEKRTVTSAMGLLRGYYGLTSPSTKLTDEGMEMAVYKSDSECHSEDEPFSPPCIPGLSGQGSWLCGDKPIVSDARATGFDNHIASATKQELYAVEPVTTVMPEHHRRPSRDRQESPGLSSSEFSNMPEHHKRPSRERLEVSGNAGDVIDVDRMIERPVRRRPKVEGTASLVDSPSEITEKQDAGGVDRTISPARLPLSTRTLGLRLRDTETPPPLPRPPLNGAQTSGEGGFSQGGSGGKVMGSSLLGGNSVENLLSKIRRTASADKFPFITPSRNRGDSPGPLQAGIVQLHTSHGAAFLSLRRAQEETNWCCLPLRGSSGCILSPVSWKWSFAALPSSDERTSLETEWRQARVNLRNVQQPVVYSLSASGSVDPPLWALATFLSRTKQLSSCKLTFLEGEDGITYFISDRVATNCAVIMLLHRPTTSCVLNLSLSSCRPFLPSYPSLLSWLFSVQSKHIPWLRDILNKRI